MQHRLAPSSRGGAARREPARALQGLTTELVVDAVDRRIEGARLGGSHSIEEFELARWRELANADAEQPDRRPGLRIEPRGEQLAGDAEDQARVLRWRSESPLARVGREILAANLDGDLSGHQFLGAQARTSAIGELGELGEKPRMIANVFGEGFFGADGSVFDIGHDRTVVDAGSPFAHAAREAAENRPQHAIRRPAEFTEGVNAVLFEPRSRLAADTG